MAFTSMAALVSSSTSPSALRPVRADVSVKTAGFGPFWPQTSVGLYKKIEVLPRASSYHHSW